MIHLLFLSLYKNEAKISHVQACHVALETPFGVTFCTVVVGHRTILTDLVLLLHTRAGTVAVANIVGALWGHRGQQGITWGNG